MIADAVSWARDMINPPSKEKPPAEFAAEARKLLRGTRRHGQVLDVPQMQARSSAGCSASARAPIRVPASSSSPTRRPVRAASRSRSSGKGVVFDSGGLSLKTGSGMETMKCDMSGGAAVVGAMSALKTLGVKQRVNGYVPARREHAERHRDPPRRRAHASATARPSKSSTPTPKAA